ncbi:hypothetical protein ACFV2N_36810 [Streptomyces sp. NPDC059680]|uniref:hypothetical protein n=1 Tax=Streptomyces sp. NPDC059680 TaxID=3346904 RepID=UPI0036896D4C
MSLGVGRPALDTAGQILAARRCAPPRSGVPADLAHAESPIGAAGACVYAWAAQAVGLAPERGTAAPARRFAHRSCREAVQLLYAAAGSAAVYTERTPLDQWLRDLVTAGRHVASLSCPVGVTQPPNIAAPSRPLAWFFAM